MNPAVAHAMALTKTTTLEQTIFGSAKAQVHADAPCAVLWSYTGGGSQDRNTNIDDDACNNKISNVPPGSVVVTYGEAAKAMRRHSRCIQRRMRSMTTEPTTYMGSDENSNTDSTKSIHKTAVVVAYLASNSIEYFLSVLAASTVTAPALLNTRWTVSEMAAALQPPAAATTTTTASCSTSSSSPSSGGSTGEAGTASIGFNVDDTPIEPSQSTSFTLLVFSNDFATQARQLSLALSSKTHCFATLELPNFCQTVTQQQHPHPSTTRPPCPRTASLNPPPLLQPLTKETESVPDHNCCRDSNDDAVIVFTSGTLGRAKGVRLSHRAILVQCHAKLQADTCAYSSTTRLFGTTVPFFHVGGLSSYFAVWLAGGTIVVPPVFDPSSSVQSGVGASFDPSAVLASVSSAGVNTLVVVPAMLFAMKDSLSRNRKFENKLDTQRSLANDGESKMDCPMARTVATTFPTVRLILIGGQSAARDLLQFTRESFPCARIIQTYACTEAASSLTFLDVTTKTQPMSSTRRLHPNESTASRPPSAVGDNVGQPPHHVQICVWDNCQQLTETSSLNVGIISTRGPHVMNGYWLRGCPVDRTSMDFYNDTWMRTTDLGYIDHNGFLFLIGRASDSIRSGGETVMAGEVEQVLQRHTAIQECAVFGIPNDKFGEIVCCALVVNGDFIYDNKIVRRQQNDNEINVDLIRLWCERQGLASYKRPRQVHIMTEPLPRNSTGKVLKRKLVEKFDSLTKVSLTSTLQSKL